MVASHKLATFIAVLLFTGTAAPALAQTVIDQRGALTTDDPDLGDANFADIYRFEGRQGDVLDVRLVSSAFDAVLLLSGPNDFYADNDDEDGASTTNARLEITLPATGTYSLVMTSLESGKTGSYRLSGQVGSGSNGSSSSAGNAGGSSMTGRLGAGDAVLNGGEYFDVFSFSGTNGQEVALALASTQFDAYLIVRSPSGEVWQNDDWQDRETSAGLVFTLPETGDYVIVASSNSAGETGDYVLGSDVLTLYEGLTPR